MTPAVRRSERRRVVEEARSWLGTPFHHGARLKGVGVDCAQLLIAVYTSAGLVEVPQVGFYAPDWFLHEQTERILDAIAPMCVEADWACVGDIALFRYGRAVSHGAIVVSTVPELTVVHSFRGFGVVEDSIALGTPLRDRLAGYWTLKRWAEVA
jgi:NlpC/P60 family putative phage cell wall peptidase